MFYFVSTSCPWVNICGYALIATAVVVVVVVVDLVLVAQHMFSGLGSPGVDQRGPTSILTVLFLCAYLRRCMFPSYRNRGRANSFGSGSGGCSSISSSSSSSSSNSSMNGERVHLLTWSPGLMFTTPLSRPDQQTRRREYARTRGMKI